MRENILVLSHSTSKPLSEDYFYQKGNQKHGNRGPICLSEQQDPCPSSYKNREIDQKRGQAT